MLDQVSTLRAQISDKINPCPGIYKWWFNAQDANILLSKLGFTNFSKLQSRVSNEEIYYALYFGISKDLRMRAKWHICQKHSQSQIKHGTLSTLRQTISALLGSDMTKSMQIVNNLLDRCYWEWDYVETHEQAKIIERHELKEQTQYAYPLNIQENETVDKSIIHNLKLFRKQHKK
jgi:IS30 family transposase